MHASAIHHLKIFPYHHAFNNLAKDGWTYCQEVIEKKYYKLRLSYDYCLIPRRTTYVSPVVANMRSRSNLDLFNPTLSV